MLYGFAIAAHCPLQMQWFAIGRLTSFSMYWNSAQRASEE
jgi:hypothetical protein